MLDSFYH